MVVTLASTIVVTKGTAVAAVDRFELDNPSMVSPLVGHRLAAADKPLVMHTEVVACKHFINHPFMVVILKEDNRVVVGITLDLK